RVLDMRALGRCERGRPRAVAEGTRTARAGPVRPSLPSPGTRHLGAMPHLRPALQSREGGPGTTPRPSIIPRLVNNGPGQQRAGRSNSGGASTGPPQNRGPFGGRVLYVVTGPPASGKSTWVRAHAKPGDVVVDYDILAGALSGAPSGNPHDHPEPIRTVAFKAR